MLLIHKRPSTIAEEMYRNESGQQIVAESLHVCNVSGGDVGFYVYVARGESFGRGNAIIYHEVLDAGGFDIIYFSLSGLQMFDNSIAIGVGASTPKTVTFTLMGSTVEHRNPRLL